MYKPLAPDRVPPADVPAAFTFHMDSGRHRYAVPRELGIPGSLARHVPPAAARLIALAREFESATLITHTRLGELHARPLFVAACDEDGTLWFVTGASSSKVDEVSEDTRATLTFQRPGQAICLNGDVHLVFDQVRIRSLWKERYRCWCEDRGKLAVVLLRFTPHAGEYWDAKEGPSGVKHVFDRAKGAAESYVEPAPGSHR